MIDSITQIVTMLSKNKLLYCYSYKMSLAFDQHSTIIDMFYSHVCQTSTIKCYYRIFLKSPIKSMEYHLYLLLGTWIYLLITQNLWVPLIHIPLGKWGYMSHGCLSFLPSVLPSLHSRYKGVSISYMLLPAPLNEIKWSFRLIFITYCAPLILVLFLIQYLLLQ